MIDAKSATKRLLANSNELFRRGYYACRFRTRNIVVHPTSWVSPRAILRCSGGGTIRVGQHCEIHDYALIDSFGGDIVLGNNCSINPYSVLYGHGGLKVGEGTRIATHVVIVPANHVFDSDLPLHLAGITGRGIDVGASVWIGAGARILDGVSIGSNAVVGAGAVVTRDVPERTIATGVPARAKPIRDEEAS